MYFTGYSLADLKKQLAEAKSQKAAAEAEKLKQTSGDGNENVGVPIEADRFLTPEDFERIKYGLLSQD